MVRLPVTTGMILPKRPAERRRAGLRAVNRQERAGPREVRMVGPGSLGAQLRRQRRDLGLTQDDVAALAQVSVRLLRDLEHGRPTVRTDKLLSVLDVLGLELTLALRVP
jgi:y4mF family transcriptional regulator